MRKIKIKLTSLLKACAGYNPDDSTLLSFAYYFLVGKIQVTTMINEIRI